MTGAAGSGPLEKAQAAGFADLQTLLDADWDALRAEPRFRKLVESDKAEIGCTGTWGYAFQFGDLLFAGGGFVSSTILFVLICAVGIFLLR